MFAVKQQRIILIKWILRLFTAGQDSITLSSPHFPSLTLDVSQYLFNHNPPPFFNLQAIAAPS